MTNDIKKRSFLIPGLELAEETEGGRLGKSCTTVSGRLNGKKVIVRAFETSASANYFKEKEVLKALALADLHIQPKIIKKNGDNLILVLSYLDGISAGDSLNFLKVFIDQIEPREIIGCLTSIKKVRPVIDLEVQKVLMFYEKKYIDIINNWPYDNLVVHSWYDFFNNEVKKDIISNSVLTHGDTNPSNILFKEIKIIGLIDWELAKYDGHMRDFSYQYYSAMNFPSWRNAYLKELNLNKQNIKFFNFYLLLSLMGDIVTWKKMLKTGQKYHYRSEYLSGDTLTALTKRNKSEIDKIVEMRIF